MRYQIQIIRSSRKTLAIQIKADLSVIVRAPYRASSAQIESFIKEHEEWINKHLADMTAKRNLKEAEPKLTGREIEQLADLALKVIPPKVEYYAQMIGVNYGNITIRNQKTRWGSCSGKGNLNFNCLLMLMPEDVINYVIVHELCHRIEMNHSKAFWSQVERVLPDYKSKNSWLKKHGPEIMQRNRK